MKIKTFFLCLLSAWSMGNNLHAQPLKKSKSADHAVNGVASYYANSMHGRKTSSGEKYDKNAYTCAHLKHPFGTLLRVTNPANGMEVIVKVNDRGPYSKRYTIDLSYAAARDLGIIRAGHAKVIIEEYFEEEETGIEIPGFVEYYDSVAYDPDPILTDSVENDEKTKMPPMRKAPSKQDKQQ